MPELRVPDKHPVAIYCMVPSSGVAKEQYDAQRKDLERLFKQSEFARRDAKFRAAWTRLDETGLMTDNWDGEGASAPNQLARTTTKTVLKMLEKAAVVPFRLMPSVVGGIGIAFIEGPRRADVEIDNDGDVVASIHGDGIPPQAWQLTVDEQSLREMIERIRLHLSV